MANAYRTKYDVSFPRVVSKISGEGDDAQYETEGVNYPAGSYVNADHMTPRDRQRAESGELDYLLEPVDESEIQGYGDHDPEFGIFVAEHEAEAHALETYGHIVVPQDQVMEALSSGAEHAADYQKAVSEAGYDRRPVQETFAQPRPRVPDQVLLGAETRSGTPHNRGPQENVNEEEEGSEAQEEGQEQYQGHETRPRPGVSQESAQEVQAETQAEQQGESGVE